MKTIKKLAILALFMAIIWAPQATALTAEETATIQTQLQEALVKLELLQKIQALQQMVETLVAQLKVVQQTQSSIQNDQSIIQSNQTRLDTKVDTIIQQVTNTPVSQETQPVFSGVSTNQNTMTEQVVHKLSILRNPIISQGVSSFGYKNYSVQVNYPTRYTLITISASDPDGLFHIGGHPDTKGSITLKSDKGTAYDDPVHVGFSFGASTSSPITFTITAPDDEITVTTE